MASNVILPGLSKCLLDTGSNTYICVRKDQFKNFKTISGKAYGIIEEALDVKNIGRVKLIHLNTGLENTLHNVHYVADATQNLFPIKKATKTGIFHFNQHGSAGQLQVGLRFSIFFWWLSKYKCCKW